MILLGVLAAGLTFSIGSVQHIVNLTNATISPDATRVAFVASRANLDHNRYDDTLEIYNLRSGSTVSRSGREQSVDSLAWSPDGTQLAAVVGDANHGAHQLFLFNPDTLQRRQLTHGSESVTQIAWRPDNKAIAFRRQDVVPKKHGADAYRDALHVGDNAYLVESWPQPSHLWLVTNLGTEHQLTRGSQNVMDSPLSWSPDGRSILYETGSVIYGLSDLAYAVRLDIASGGTTAATPHTSEVDQALYSPDGSQLAYLRPQGGDLVNQVDAWVTSRAATKDGDASLRLNRYVTTVAWMGDSKSLLLQIDDRTQQPLVIQRLDGGSERVPMGSVVGATIQSQGSVARNGTIVFIGDEPTRPDEVYILLPKARSPKRLTSFNDSIAAQHLGKVQRLSWRSSDGYIADGVLTYPVDYVPGRKYPLVLRIHGGPNESSTLAFYDFAQLAASHGYLVFRPNYRGSTDLGAAWVRAILDDPNVGPSRDIMEGIAAVERLGIVDESRIGVSGWSYGGMLTYWLETHHTFAAAVAGAGVSDILVDYAIADDIDADRIMFRSAPTPFHGQALSLWRNQSAISYAENVRTPTLILCNMYDVRVPIVESYEMFHALRDNGIPVEFYAYPTGGHLPRGPVRELDAYARWLAWFDRYLR